MNANEPDWLARFSGKRILVVGDLMLDRYLYGTVSRISPEAPVPVLDLQQSDNRLGGAANVAVNLKALGCDPVLCGIIGNDREGQQLNQLIGTLNLRTDGLIWSSDRRTTVKTRAIAQGQHILRVDSEDRSGLSTKEENAIKHFVSNLLEEGRLDAIVLQDYNKGLLSAPMIQWLIQIANRHGVPSMADPKKDHLEAFKGITLFKPNLKEINDLLNMEVLPEKSSLEKATRRLREIINQRYTLITLSQNGLYIEDNGDGFIEPTVQKDIVDVCGAGDTVLSIAAAGIAAGLDLKNIAILSNLAGGQVCETVGVVPLDCKRLADSFEKIGDNHNKIIFPKA